MDSFHFSESFPLWDSAGEASVFGHWRWNINVWPLAVKHQCLATGGETLVWPLVVKHWCFATGGYTRYINIGRVMMIWSLLDIWVRNKAAEIAQMWSTSRVFNESDLFLLCCVALYQSVRSQTHLDLWYKRYRPSYKKNTKSIYWNKKWWWRHDVKQKKI